MTEEREITENKIEADEIIDSEEIEELEDLNKESYKSILKKADLYFRIVNILTEKKDKFEGTEIYKELEKIKIDEQLQSDIEIINSENFGTYFAEQRIKSYVVKNQKDIKTLIELFFKIISEEE